MHLTETGQTHIKNDVHLINKILNTIGLVITEDIYASELNPKNRNPLLDALDVLLFLLAAHELRKYTAVAVVLLGLFGTAR